MAHPFLYLTDADREEMLAALVMLGPRLLERWTATDVVAKPQPTDA